jgi:hypothetical protein
MLPSPEGMWCMKQGGGYVIFVDNLIKFHVEVCTKIILTL